MTEYEICQKRGHTAFAPDRALDSQAYSQWEFGRGEWETCRWCGAKFKELAAPKQIEQARAAR